MRLLKRVEYEAVYGAGQRRSSPQFSVFFRAQIALPNEAIGREAPREGSFAKSLAASRASRFGISVKKALGGAVVRNRMKRRLREAVRLHSPAASTPVDVVINPKKSLLAADFRDLREEISRAFAVIEKSLRKR